MFLSKTRKFTTTLAAAALAMSTLIATPVQAKNEDLAKLFVGATALFIIGNAINENNRKTQQARRDPPRPQPDWRDDRRHDRDRGRDDHRPGRAYDSRPTYPRYQPRPVMAVPSHCLVMTYVDGYRAKGYSAAAIVPAGNLQPPGAALHLSPGLHAAERLAGLLRHPVTARRLTYPQAARGPSRQVPMDRSMTVRADLLPG